MYDSWDTELNRQNFFSFWTNFYSFTAPPTPPTQQPKELNFWKNEKKKQKKPTLEASSFYTSAP